MQTACFRSGALTEKSAGMTRRRRIHLRSTRYKPRRKCRGNRSERENRCNRPDLRLEYREGRIGVSHRSIAKRNANDWLSRALTLWLSIDTPDVDLAECDLYEIQPDGTSIAIVERPATGSATASRCARPKLVKPGEIVRCDFNPGLFVARRLMKGSRLRLVVSAVNSILWQKNYCSGGGRCR